MPTLDALDYSWARPNIGAMAAAGIQLVGRYLYNDGPGGKGLDPDEVAALHAAGIGIWVGYEADSGNHLKGAAQGAQDGFTARVIARSLNVPAGTPIYYACDRQVIGATAHQVTVAYLHAADDPTYPARCYSQKSVGEAFGRPFWQTIAWSGGQLSSLAVLYQYQINQLFQGASVDYNTILGSDHGAWMPAGHAVQGGGTPVTNPVTPTPEGEEDDMTQAFLVPGKSADGSPSNRWWAVAIDYSTRVQVLDIGNAQALAGTVEERKPFINASMTYGQLQAIPDVSYHDTPTKPAFS